MKAINFIFQIHQPYRLKRYRFFDIGNDHYYYDDFANDEIITRIAQRSYMPACETLLRMIQDSKGKFRCAIAISGDALEQCEQYVPEFIDLLKKLADTGKVEFLGAPYAYSLASLGDAEEFADQIKLHRDKIQALFGQSPKVLRNTELIYSDEIAPQLVELGFKGVVTEGAKHVLGWKSPDYVYSAATAPKLKLLLNNSKLADDIARRFSDTNWDSYPLTADKYMDWVASTPAEEQVINLCMNLEAFGELHPRESGIFQFLEALPRFAAERGIDFWTPSETVSKLKAVDVLSIGHPVSAVDDGRDVSAWLGNRLQNEAFAKLYSVTERVRLCDDRRLKMDWLYLQGADHFYYMSTKNFGDGAAAANFSPYGSPYEAFTNYMNVLADFIVRVEEQYPMSIENEELNSLLTTIRNQATELETLTKENDSLRRSLEQFNVEHNLRTGAEIPASSAKPAAEKKPAAKKPAAKKAAAKPAAEKKAEAKKPAAKKAASKTKAEKLAKIEKDLNK
ncbi:MAG: glycoside hydrolase family 57 protein [Muribaculaceae bacterium]|nr:glycoside hydrolase family 57 protein [Muribaculaceae bacterium]